MIKEIQQNPFYFCSKSQESHGIRQAKSEMPYTPRQKCNAVNHRLADRATAFTFFVFIYFLYLLNVKIIRFFIFEKPM